MRQVKWRGYLLSGIVVYALMFVGLSNGCRKAPEDAPKPQATPTLEYSQPLPIEPEKARRIWTRDVIEIWRASFRSKLFDLALVHRDDANGQRGFYVPVRSFCRRVVELKEKPPDFAPVWHFDTRTITIKGKSIGPVYLLHQTGYVKVKRGQKLLGYPIDASEAGFLIIG